MPTDENNNALCWNCGNPLARSEEGAQLDYCGYCGDEDKSIFEQMGCDKEKCKYCNAHLRNGICLNGCHLSHGIMRKLQQYCGG